MRLLLRARFVAGEGDGVGCVVVTLPAGWTALGLTDGLPAGWTGTVDGAALMVMWQADTAEDRLLLPGDAASFTVTAIALSRRSTRSTPAPSTRSTPS